MSVKKEIVDNEAKIHIKFGYSAEYVFPYDEGIQLMSMFKHAESVDTSDYAHPSIVPMKESPTIKIIAIEAYKEMKMTALISNGSDLPK